MVDKTTGARQSVLDSQQVQLHEKGKQLADVALPTQRQLQYIAPVKSLTSGVQQQQIMPSQQVKVTRSQVTQPRSVSDDRQTTKGNQVSRMASSKAINGMNVSYFLLLAIICM